jgi:CRP/FNR family cyclic AMP-dependent transcriptional regulator
MNGQLLVPQEMRIWPMANEKNSFSGFTRTLSTDMLRKQMETELAQRVEDLIDMRTYGPGEVIIRKGETNRDLLFLTDGLVEISTEQEDGRLILNELSAPYVFGEIAFLLGSPRTATATARAGASAFILRYEKFKSIFKENPAWLQPLLTSFVNGIKSLHFKVANPGTDLE